MAQPLRREIDITAPSADARVAARPRGPAWEAYLLLYAAFIAAPLIAGIDKFFDVLVPWHNYLAPAIAQKLPLAPHTFMMIVGAIEIVAALIVAAKPSIGGWIVGLWLWGIILNLLLARGFYDVALRDFGLSLGAFALARLAIQFERRRP